MMNASPDPRMPIHKRASQVNGMVGILIGASNKNADVTITTEAETSGTNPRKMAGVSSVYTRAMMELAA